MIRSLCNFRGVNTLTVDDDKSPHEATECRVRRTGIPREPALVPLLPPFLRSLSLLLCGAPDNPEFKVILNLKVGFLSQRINIRTHHHHHSVIGPAAPLKTPRNQKIQLSVPFASNRR